AFEQSLKLAARDVGHGRDAVDGKQVFRVLLHHHDGEVDAAVARFQSERIARLEVGGVAPVADLENFQRIALRGLADVVTHQRCRKIGDAAAAGTGGDLAVESKNLLGGRTDIGEPAAEFAV